MPSQLQGRGSLGALYGTGERVGARETRRGDDFGHGEIGVGKQTPHPVEPAPQDLLTGRAAERLLKPAFQRA